VIGEAGRADAGALVARLLRLDSSAVVRLRPGPDDLVELWAMLPFRVLVTRAVTSAASKAGPAGAAGLAERDVTVLGADLLQWLSKPDMPFPAPRDQLWRWPLPPSGAIAVESVSAVDIQRVADAASVTLRDAATHGVGGRTAGERVVREALLDHVPITVTSPSGQRVEVSQRLVQALVRMNFLVRDGEGPVTVRVIGAWIGLSATYGSCWHRPTSSLLLN
jgi:hypothetical protein